MRPSLIENVEVGASILVLTEPYKWEWTPMRVLQRADIGYYCAPYGEDCVAIPGKKRLVWWGELVVVLEAE